MKIIPKVEIHNLGTLDGRLVGNCDCEKCYKPKNRKNKLNKISKQSVIKKIKKWLED